MWEWVTGIGWDTQFVWLGIIVVLAVIVSVFNWVKRLFSRGSSNGN